MPNKENDGLVDQQSCKKKISFFSAILVVMGSSIGAGIFFRSEQVLKNSQNSLILAIFCWIIAAFSVIAMGLALVEISSVRNDNLSLLGWTKTFNKRKTFKASKNFMLYLYLPLNLFYMPLYFIMSLQDGLGALINKEAATFGTSVDWLLWTLISIGVSLYFMIVSGLNSKIGNIQNKIFTYIKFIPLVIVSVVGIVLVGLNAGGSINIGFEKPTINVNGNIINDSLEKGASFSLFFPGIGMFLSISAIFFTYDGFYVAAGIQSEMKEPKKTPMVILFGLVITTIIYLIVAISMSINGGSFSNMRTYMENEWKDIGRILFGLVNIMIAIGVIGIINSYSIWMPRYAENLIKEGEVPFSIKFKDKLNEDRPIVGVVFYIIWTIPLVIIFTLIGALAYINNYKDVYGSGMGKLYTFADLIATWMSMFTFLFIVTAIFGGIINRKTNKIKTNKSSYFLLTAWICVIVIGLSSLVTILMPFIDLIMIVLLDKNEIKIVGRNYEEIVIGRIMLVVTLFINAFLTFGIQFIEDKIIVKKYGSIAKYEEWQRENFQI